MKLYVIEEIMRQGLVAGALLGAVAGVARADVAATGTFGIDISVPFPFTSGTFDGEIASFDAGPFSVGGTPVDLAGAVGTMEIVDGQIPSIDVPALAATFNFDASAPALGFHGAGIAVCSSNIINCAAGQATFVGDITALVDGSGLLPDGHVYTFDGTGGDNPGSGFDAIGNFGINAFLPVDVPAGNPVTAASDPTSFFDSRHNVLPAKLAKVLGKKLGKAKALIGKAGAASKLAKAEKSVAKARAQVEKAAAKAAKFVTKKKPISAACNDTIRAVTDVILAAIDEGRLGVALPAE